MVKADPFDNATKQVNDACDVLGIKDKGMREYLAIPNRILRLKLPVKLDNGKIRIFIGFRSQHNNDRVHLQEMLQLEWVMLTALEKQLKF